MHTAGTPLRSSRRLPLPLAATVDRATREDHPASAMAGCHALETDDLHRRCLPREIFADIGIVDVADPVSAAVHLPGGGVAPATPLPPLLPVPAPYQQHHHAAPIHGFPGKVLAPYGGGAPAAWPVLPYHPPPQWQVGISFGNGGGVAMPAPLRPYGGPPSATRLYGGGTGVFLPRTEAYQQHKAAAKSAPKDVKAPKKEPEKKKQQQPQQRQRGWEKVQQRPKVATAAVGTTAPAMQQNENASEVLLALPLEWTY